MRAVMLLSMMWLACPQPKEGARAASIQLGAKLDDFPHEPPQPATPELFDWSIPFAKATTELLCCDRYARVSQQPGTESCTNTIGKGASPACTALAARLRVAALGPPYVNEPCYLHARTKWTHAVVDEEGSIVGIRAFCTVMSELPRRTPQ